MTRCEQIDFRVRRDDPEPVRFALERVHRGALVQVPDADRLVLADRKDEILMRVEQTS